MRDVAAAPRSSPAPVSGMAALLLFLAASSMTIRPASGHGYVNSPRSRNIVAHLDGVDYTSNPTPSTPMKDYDPMSINRGGLCGVNPFTPFNSTHNINYSFPPNYSGGFMPENIQATYAESSIIELEAVFTAHHYGHITYKACPLAEHGLAPTQACFDAHPLTLVEDVSGGLPLDPNYPERAYLPPPDGMETGGTPSGKVMRQRYRLPPGLNGDLVLIQFHYITANTCFPVGYDTYPYPYPRPNLSDCPEPLDECGEVGGGRPEQVSPLRCVLRTNAENIVSSRWLPPERHSAFLRHFPLTRNIYAHSAPSPCVLF